MKELGAGGGYKFCLSMLCIPRVGVARACSLGSLQHVGFDSHEWYLGVCLSMFISYMSGFGQHCIRCILEILSFVFV